MAMHAFVRFEPRPGAEAGAREVLRAVVVPTRAEPGCISIALFESLREPVTFAIHSVWRDEAAFETHAELPHTVRFIADVEPLLTHSVKVQRTSQIA